jgi:hypothetical protein
MQRGAKDKSYWPEILLGACVLLMAVRVLSRTMADFDLWGYLAFGRLFWKSGGHFPYHDIFTYVPTLPRWVYHEWLTGVIYYPLYQHVGAPGLQLLKFALGLATTGLLFLTARRRGADVLAILLIFVIIAPFYVAGYSPVRAQIFTYLFFVLTLYWLETSRQTGRYRHLWLLAPLMVLWCNLHGGFLAGLGLLLIYALGEGLSRRPFWPYLAVFFVAALATLINPYGLDYWLYLFRAVTMARPEIIEWQSLLTSYETHNITLLAASYFLLVACIFFCLAWLARWRELSPILVSGLTLFLALKHVRHQVFFLLAVGAYAPVLLAALLERIRRDGTLAPLLNRLGWKIPSAFMLIFAAVMMVRIICAAPLSLTIPGKTDPGNKHDIYYYPVGGLDYIQAHNLSGNLLTQFHWGEYLLWNLYPTCKVALDGRYETVYPAKVCGEYFDFIDARPDWRNFLQKYDTRMILVMSSAKICSRLEAEPDWRLLYHDVGCALFVKTPSVVSAALKGTP